MSALATVVICARNAAHTIGRALRSAAPTGYPVLLVDDHSDDDTVAAARAIGMAVEVTRPAAHRTIGLARQTAIERVSTPWIIWLDADDELLPGRQTRLQAEGGDGADIVADDAELVDGRTGTLTGIARTPEFVHRYPVRLFERMFLPAPGAIAVSTSLARRVGYDTDLHGAEDSDFLLRALAGGARLRTLDSVGYRIWTYPDSLSRDRRRQRAMYARALARHPYSVVDRLYRQAGLDRATSLWAQVSIALFRQEPREALTALDHLAQLGLDPHVVGEPGGPWPFTNGWRLAFARGTSLLLMGARRAAMAELVHARRLRAAPEVLNNLGVARAGIGMDAEARGLFAQALQLCPGYADAAENAAAATPAAITTHPLRVELARQDYDASRPAVTRAS